MTRVHAERVDVERGPSPGRSGPGPTGPDAGGCHPAGPDREYGSDQPGRFGWREGEYVVHAVLDHWLEAGAWWRRIGPTGGGAVLGLDDGEQEIWRVEASRGRSTGPVGVFDLRYERGSGQWSLIRVQD